MAFLGLTIRPGGIPTGCRAVTVRRRRAWLGVSPTMHNAEMTISSGTIICPKRRTAGLSTVGLGTIPRPGFSDEGGRGMETRKPGKRLASLRKKHYENHVISRCSRPRTGYETCGAGAPESWRSDTRVRYQSPDPCHQHDLLPRLGSGAARGPDRRRAPATGLGCRHVGALSG